MLTLRGEHFNLGHRLRNTALQAGSPAEITLEFTHVQHRRCRRYGTVVARPTGVTRNMQPLLRMAWETSPPLVLASIIFRLVRALLPLAMLWVSKPSLMAWWPDYAAAVICGHLESWLLELTLAVASDVLGRANTLCDSLLATGSRIGSRAPDGARLAVDLASFEDPCLQNWIAPAVRLPGAWATGGSLNIGQDAVTLVSLSTGLTFSPWLMALLAAAVIPSFSERRTLQPGVFGAYRRTPERRKLDYLRLLARARSAKEVKISGRFHLSKHYDEVSADIFKENRLLRFGAIVSSALNVFDRRLLRGLCGGAGANHCGAVSLGSFTFLTK